MPAFHCTMILHCGAYGWEESFYLQSDTAAAAMRSLSELATARLPLLDPSVVIARIRVSTEPASRAHLVQGVGRTQNPRGVLCPWNAIQITLDAGTPAIYHRCYLLRGLPKSSFVFDNADRGHLTPAMEARLNDWLQQLSRLGFSLRCLDKRDPLYEFLDSFPAEDLPGLVDDLGDVLDLGERTLLAYFEAETKDRFVRHVFVPITSWSIDRTAKRSTGRGGKSGYPIAAAAAARPGFLQAPVERPDLLSQLFGDEGTVGPTAPQPELVVSNARQLIALINQGYGPGDVNAPGYPIGIWPILNLPGYWLVTVSGTDLREDQATGLQQDVEAGIGLASKLRAAVKQAIALTVPGGNQVILAGHSLGGMECQWVGLGKNGDVGYRLPYKVITFGSPRVWNKPIGLNGDHHFRMLFDAVPVTGPMGKLDSVKFFPGHTVVDAGDVPPDPYSRHTRYQDLVSLEAYNAVGDPIAEEGPFSLQLGVGKRFPAPR